MQDLKICNGWYLIQSHNQVLIQTDASRKVRGAVCQGISTGGGRGGGAMFNGRTLLTHKCIGTESNKISTFDLQRTKIFESSSFSNRQHHCTTLPCKNGGNRKPNVTENKPRNLAVFLEAPDNNY